MWTRPRGSDFLRVNTQQRMGVASQGSNQMLEQGQKRIELKSSYKRKNNEEEEQRRTEPLPNLPFRSLLAKSFGPMRTNFTR